MRPRSIQHRSNVYDQTTGSAKTITITSLENALYSDPIIESQESASGE